MTTEKAEVSRGRKISGIWFIPLLALVLGVYMVIHNWMTEGPEIEIAFKTASGLEEGKTRVKYRNVNMGTVSEVRLNESFDGIVATVKMNRQAADLLRKDTNFWVVTARVGVGNVSGLDTLLSGAYIQLAPGSEKKSSHKFVALEQPPLTPADAPGLRLQLTSDEATSVTAGDQVLFKGSKVGRVESRDFDAADELVHYQVFIDAPYHTLVNSNVRFWNTSGVSLSADASGFKIVTGSLETILFGGVTFGVPEGVKPGTEVTSNTVFNLHSSYDEVLSNPFRHTTSYVIYFDQSVKGLLPGAPVEYRGIPIGKIEKILLKEEQALRANEGAQGRGTPIPVLISMEPARFELPDDEDSVALMRESIELGVSNGLRATMASGSLLTGAKYIDFDFYPDAEPAALGSFLEYTTIPTIDTGLAQLEQKVNSILDTINALPLKQTVTEVNVALNTLNQSLEGLQTIMENQSTQQLPVQLDETLQELRTTISGLSPNSAAYQSLNASLLSLSRSMDNLESLTRTLSEHPNAVIVPSNQAPDLIPEASQ